MKKMEFQIDTYARIYFEADDDFDVAEFWASLTQEKLEELSNFAPRTLCARVRLESDTIYRYLILVTGRAEPIRKG